MDNPTIIASLISAGVAIVVLLVNYRMNRRSERVQREIANQNIDANIIAKSRIEWIQEVRKATSKLIAAYSELAKTDPNNSKEYLGKVIDLQEKNEILILFFGNDNVSDEYYSTLRNLIYIDIETSNFIVTEEARGKLLEMGSNKNKNDIIVFYLRALKEYFDYFNNNYFSKHKNKDRLEKNRDDSHERFIFPVKGGKTYDVLEPVDEEGTLVMSSYPIEFDNEAEKEYQGYVDQLKFFDIPISIIEDMLLLSEIMRVYLKIEWKEAKTNK